MCCAVGRHATAYRAISRQAENLTIQALPRYVKDAETKSAVDSLSRVAGTRSGEPGIGIHTLATSLTDISAFKHLKLLGGYISF